MEQVVPDEIVQNKIYYLRDQKVMLDSDLAELYGIGTKVLNQAVSRNKNRFPGDFMFQLNELEWANLRSQFVTANWSRRRTLPYVFTEHGVLMLSSVLSSERAVNVNIQVMRVFTKIRQMLLDNTDLRYEIEKIKDQLSQNDKNMTEVFGYLDELLQKGNPVSFPRIRIGFKPDELC